MKELTCCTGFGVPGAFPKFRGMREEGVPRFRYPHRFGTGTVRSTNHDCQYLQICLSLSGGPWADVWG